MIREMVSGLLTADTAETDEGTRLKEHVADAQLLLAYAAEEGLHVEQQLVSDIISSRCHLQDGSLDQAKEVQFWTAFDALSKKIRPVSIESIKATRLRRRRSWRLKLLDSFFSAERSDAAQTVLVYQRWTLFALVILLIVQIYWLVGSAIITQVTQKQSFQEEITQLADLMNQAETLGNAELGSLIGQIREKYENKALDINSSNTIYYKSLKDWRSNIFTNWIFNQNTDKQAQTDQEDYSKVGYIEARQSAQLILQPIQQYILPLLYGWIGALAYVLRSINREIKEITYTSQSNEHYRLRTQLGALSGLAVGWFLSVDPEDYAAQNSFSFGSLSPLALSFLAGYSVELLFSAMDKIVEAFSSSPQKPA
ncbi:hypothetical protein [Candidatus Electronema sp. TJ]|uniref:hypothetical protein n=1 Tax=Candidatus Electronema sp. TJ TaxID=3401573 RepID=UPI003AA92A4B